MKISKFFIFVGLASTFTVASIVGLPKSKQVEAKQACRVDLANKIPSSIVSSKAVAQTVAQLNKTCWNQLPGLARDIGVGANGAVWVIGTNAVSGGYGIYRWTGSNWQNVPGGAVRIDVAPNGIPWVVNNAGNIYQWTGSSWQQLPGLARDIGIGANGAVWVIGTNAVGGGYGIYRWTGSNWQNVPGGAVRIDVAPNGTPWVVNNAGNIYQWTGSSWQQLPGLARDIGIGGTTGNGVAWVIGTNGVGGGYGIYQWIGSNWQNVPGGAVEISVGPDGYPWVVNNAGSIYR
jgi:hypothetical protein